MTTGAALYATKVPKSLAAAPNCDKVHVMIFEETHFLQSITRWTSFLPSRIIAKRALSFGFGSPAISKRCSASKREGSNQKSGDPPRPKLFCAVSILFSIRFRLYSHQNSTMRQYSQVQKRRMALALLVFQTNNASTTVGAYVIDSSANHRASITMIEELSRMRSTDPSQRQSPEYVPQLERILAHPHMDRMSEDSSASSSTSSCPFARMFSSPQVAAGAQHTTIATTIGNDASAVAAAAMAIALPLPATSTIIPSAATISPLEAWCLTHLDRFYHQSQAIKCPFLRRRYGDLLDDVEQVVKHTVIRRQCWPLMGPPQAWRPAGCNKKLQRLKYQGISLTDLRTLVWQDWKPSSGKGYYVTGKLTTACYRDDCLFLGPDPDMPIRGLRKYVGVAAHLFDSAASRATLKSLDIVEDTLVAEWQLRGILRLPWKPHLPTFSGTTVYHVDENGLVKRHEEFWKISVLHAFCFTLFPGIAKRIWNEEDCNS